MPSSRGISVAELEAYPGIGPVTISKLRQGGYTTWPPCMKAASTSRAWGRSGWPTWPTRRGTW